MTAINCFTQPDAAYLLTDGAVTERDGTLADIGRKVHLLPDLRMAVAWSGRLLHDNLEAAVDVSTDQARALASLPRACQRLVAINQQDLPGATSADEVGVRLHAAIWSDEKDEPQIWAVHSDNHRFGPRYPPYSLVRLSMTLDSMPEQLTEIFGRPVNLASPESFSAMVDGVTLLEAQRKEPWIHDDGALVFAIGGHGALTAVSRTGVDYHVLCEWPDKIGEPIKP